MYIAVKTLIEQGVNVTREERQHIIKIVNTNIFFVTIKLNIYKESKITIRKYPMGDHTISVVFLQQVC